MSGLSERDVERLADWLGSLPESHNTTWIAVAVDSLAYRIVESDWLAERDAAIRDEAKAEGWNEALEATAWCIANGESSAVEVLAYVQKHYPHRALLDGGDL